MSASPSKERVRLVPKSALPALARALVGSRWKRSAWPGLVVCLGNGIAPRVVERVTLQLELEANDLRSLAADVASRPRGALAYVVVDSEELGADAWIAAFSADEAVRSLRGGR